MTLQRQIVAIVLCMVLAPESGFAADLSPRKWNPAEKAQAELGEMSPSPTQARVVEGKTGLVTGTMSPIAVRAGVEALKQGGTAADAAATVALTQITTALGSYVSYAGVLQLVYYEAKTGKVYSLNAGWNSYLARPIRRAFPWTTWARLRFGIKPTEGAEGRKTLVPGFMAGIEAMHKRFGKLKFERTF